MGASNDKLVRLIFESCAELSRRTGRSVSPDGHFVRSLGETYAAQELELILETASNAGFDATDADGTRIESKTTTRSSISLSAEGTLAERLVVVQLDRHTGEPRIVYDGPASVAWELAGPPAKNGQRRLATRRLLDRN